jgi:hypothetical protein
MTGARHASPCGKARAVTLPSATPTAPTKRTESAAFARGFNRNLQARATTDASPSCRGAPFHLFGLFCLLSCCIALTSCAPFLPGQSIGSDPCPAAYGAPRACIFIDTYKLSLQRTRRRFRRAQ